nr:hypothetical protein [Tanacetum cinerariifolium]
MLKEGRVELGCLKVHFIGCPTAHFGLVSDQGLRSLSMVTRELLLIDLHKLICIRVGDTRAWVAPRPERQPNATAPQPPPPAPRTMQWRISMLEEEAFDSTLVGSLQFPYQRHTKRRIDDASTLVPQQTDP